MKLTTNNIIIIFGSMILCVLALIPISVLAMPLFESNRTESDPQATVQAMVTQTVISMTLNAPTPLPPSATPVPATNTPVPTATTVPATAPVTYCDWMAFVTDITVPDGTNFQPGETFTKIWRIKNRGTCTWTSDYMLVFNGGDQMGSTTSVRLPGYVAPGQSIDISVTFTAPNTHGSYKGYWILRNTSGTLFGSGDKANTPIYVDIRVKQQPTTPAHGTVGGNLCFPSEFNPPMTLYLENAHTGERFQFAIAESQYVYEVLVPAGRYYAYAWAPGYNLEGAYTHSNGLMKSFFVEGGLTTPFINLCDWGPYGHAKGE